MSVNSEDPVIQKLIAIGERYDSIRAVVMTSTRCNPSARLDPFSDYDIEIFTEDPDQFAESDEWFEALGPVLIVQRLRQGWGEPQFRGWSRLVVYEDGTRVDFQVTNLHHLKKAVESLSDGYDIGYKVLLDKDGLAASLNPPTYRAFIPGVPSEQSYSTRVNDFWWDSTCVAKFLWRDDLLAVKFMLEGYLIHLYLREMLEWSIEIERGWNWRPGHYGRDIKKALDPETYKELAGVYAGGDIEVLWESLFRTAALFRKVAIRVGEALGYEYLHDLDRRVTIYHETVRNLDRSATSTADLARLLKESFRE